MPWCCDMNRWPNDQFSSRLKAICHRQPLGLFQWYLNNKWVSRGQWTLTERKAMWEPPLSTCSLCVFCTGSDCCAENTLLPPFDEPDDFCVCEFGGLGSFGLKIHPCSWSYFPAGLHCWHCVGCQTLYFMLSGAGCCIYFEHCSYLLLEISQWLWLRLKQFWSKFHHLLNRFGRHGKLQLTAWHYVLETWGGGSD